MKELVILDGGPMDQQFPLRSLSFGEGVFETFRWKGDFPVFWEHHLRRMKEGATTLGIPFPKENYLREKVAEAVSLSKIEDSYIKICLLSKGSPVFHEKPTGSSLLVIVKEHRDRPESVKICISSLRRNSASPIPRIKSLNYLENILARREVNNRGYDEAIFLNERDEVAEGSTCNLFWLNGETLFTPSVECGILPGVTRSIVINVAVELGINFKEGKFSLDKVLLSDCAFTTNSSIGAIPVSKLEETEMNLESPDFLRIKEALLDKLEWT